MPRRKNTRPTNIYWLYDTRPEKVAEFGPEGQPFYCGKTVESPNERLQAHRYAATKYPRRLLSKRLFQIGTYVRVQLIEVVPADADWIARERYWIKELRERFPGAVNVTDGGSGTAGWIATAKTRAKMRAGHIGKTHSRETIAKMSAAKKGKPKSQEHIENMRASRLGNIRSPETRAKISVRVNAFWRSPETLARKAAERANAR
jgi:hypothetical protein